MKLSLNIMASSEILGDCFHLNLHFKQLSNQFLFFVSFSCFIMILTFAFFMSQRIIKE